ncbi:MAG: 30S ribosomal protein S20 [bacterium]|nr:30S ribosomal protein S20 [bacterium]
MPVLKHAKKKLRQDKKRTLANRKVKDSYKKAFKAAVKLKTAQALAKAYQAIDKAAKQNILHQNKAARLKSSLAKLVPSGGTKAKATAVKAETKKAPVKKAAAKTTKKASK